MIVVGISHKTASVESREKFSLSQERLDRILSELKGDARLAEAAVLSTCNRTEIYSVSPEDNARLRDHCVEFFKSHFGAAELETLLYAKSDRDMVAHLFKVASGLDSMVLGENEILKQVKEAYGAAHQKGLTGKILNVLFQRALYLGKFVRTHTGLSQGGLSVGSVAVNLAEKIFGDLSESSVLIFGAGEMAEASARFFLSRKVRELSVANRTRESAVALARQIGARPLAFEEGLDHLPLADIVLTSTSAPEPFITRERVETSMKQRHNRSLFLIDIAVPRNVSASVHEMDNVYLYNIDDLQAIVADNLKNHGGEVEKALKIVQQKTDEFDRWIQSVKAGEEKSLKHSAESLRGSSPI